MKTRYTVKAIPWRGVTRKWTFIAQFALQDDAERFATVQRKQHPGWNVIVSVNAQPSGCARCGHQKRDHHGPCWNNDAGLCKCAGYKVKQ